MVQLVKQRWRVGTNAKTAFGGKSRMRIIKIKIHVVGTCGQVVTPFTLRQAAVPFFDVNDDAVMLLRRLEVVFELEYVVSRM